MRTLAPAKTALAAASFLLSMTAPSCKGLVFEDRTPCPSWVTVVLRNPVPDTEATGTVLHLWKDGKVNSCGTHTRQEFAEGVTVALRKGEAAFSGLAGALLDADDSPPSLLTAEKGRMFPPWYAFYVPGKEYGEGDTTVETDQWQMYNNLTVNVRGAGYEFRVVCHCGVDGFEYPSLALHEGAFDIETDLEEYRWRTARLPRQSLGQEGEEAPFIRVDFEYHAPDEDKWYTIYSIDLGHYLDEGRYDWSAPIPEDICLEVELARGAVLNAAILVAGWRKVLLDSGGGDLLI